MKYTDSFFKFPIKIYDKHSVDEAERLEDATGSSIEADWVVGSTRIRIEDIIGWYDAFPKGANLDEIEKSGFPETIIETKELGSFCCLWNRKKFETEFNKFHENLNQKLSESKIKGYAH